MDINRRGLLKFLGTVAAGTLAHEQLSWLVRQPHSVINVFEKSLPNIIYVNDGETRWGSDKLWCEMGFNLPLGSVENPFKNIREAIGSMADGEGKTTIINVSKNHEETITIEPIAGSHYSLIQSFINPSMEHKNVHD